MTLESQVVRLLKGPVASRIRFSFDVGYGRLTVSRRSFLGVAIAIENGSVSVANAGALRANVAAQYVSAANRIEVPKIIGRTEEGLLLHECLHAHFDITRSGLTMVDEESAAYVVDALYFRMTGLRSSRWNARLHALAGGVANGLLHEYQRGKTPIPPVDGAPWDALQAAITASPTYAGVFGYDHSG